MGSKAPSRVQIPLSPPSLFSYKFYFRIYAEDVSFGIYAHVAQLDRVPGYEPGGREFESLRVRQVFDFLFAPVAQLDRVPGFEPGGREFESLRARQNKI